MVFANDFLSLFSSRVWGGTAAELSLLISDSLQGLAEAQEGGAHANECGICVTEPQ